MGKTRLPKVRLTVLAGVLFPERDCSTCTDTQKRERGCETDSPIPPTLDGKLQLRCPLRGYREDPEGFSDLFRAYNWAQKGVLGEPGGYMDQPGRLLCLMECVEKAVSDGHSAQREREASRQRARGQAKRFVGSGRRPARARRAR